MPPSSNRPVCWVLAAPGAGDNRQMETLVGLLDLQARWFREVDPVGRVLADRVTGFRARSIPRDRRDRYRQPWPDLVLIAGGRSVIDARRIRSASQGRAKVVCIGRPWAPLRWFDLVVTTPQYRLPPADNVVTLPLPMNLPPTVDRGVSADWAEALGGLPRPWLGVLLGGDSGSFRFSAGSARKLAGRLNRCLGPVGGSAIVVGSPRTPDAAVAAIRRGLEVPARVDAFSPGSGLYGALFGIADALMVTSDSASMLAEACFSGLPVCTFDLDERPGSRAARRFRRLAPFLQPSVRRLTARGLWVPARDLDALKRAVAERGWARPMDERFPGGPAAPADPGEVLKPACDRIRALLARPAT